MRIFRTIILLTGIAVLLPSPPDSELQEAASLSDATVMPGLVATAANTVSDVASFCVRQPDVCDTAGYIAGKMEAKAKYSVKLIYEWANEPAEAPEAPAAFEQAIADPLETGSNPGLRLISARESQSTLKLEDLIPEWRGPVTSFEG
jgi:hypothetical protein